MDSQLSKRKRRNKKKQNRRTNFPVDRVWPSATEADNVQYVDFVNHISSTSTTSPISMLSVFLTGAGVGIVPAQPALGRLTAVAQGSTNAFRYQMLLKISKIHLRVRWVGSQSNTIASGDLYNTGRVAVYASGETFQSTNLPLFTTVDDIPDMRDSTVVFHDKTVGLSSTAFDSSSLYNVPRVLCYEKTIPTDLVFKCWSTESTGTSTWETQYGDLLYQSVSDSSVAPNPQLFVNCRMWYTILQS